MSSKGEINEPSGWSFVLVGVNSKSSGWLDEGPGEVGRYCQVTTAELLLYATAINMGTGENGDTDGAMRHGGGKGLEYNVNSRGGRKKEQYTPQIKRTKHERWEWGFWEGEMKLTDLEDDLM